MKKIICNVTKYATRISCVILVIVIVLLLVRLIIRERIRETTKITNKDGIDELISLELAGVKQWLYIRGNDTSNPVLLWLDGGPGEPLTTYCRDIGKKTNIEDEFTVIYWDQPGSGKSCGSYLEKGDFTYDKFISYIHEITQYSKKRFHTDKIYLLGRSWGSRIGLSTINKYPEDYWAYIGVGQVVNSRQSTIERAEFVISHLEEDNKLEEANQIKEYLEQYRKDNKSSFANIQKYVEKYEGFSKSGRAGIVSYSITSALVSPDYSLKDLMNLVRWYGYSQKALRENGLPNTPIESTDILKIPCYFFEGRYDKQVSSKLAQQYIETYQTTSTKKIIWFENSAHVVNDDEPKKFFEELVKVKKETLQVHR